MPRQISRKTGGEHETDESSLPGTAMELGSLGR